MPRIPDSIRFFDCTIEEIFSQRGREETVGGTVAVLVGWAMVVATPWLEIAIVPAILSFMFGLVQLSEARHYAKQLELELVRKVMEQ
jgi:hypothetical protein